MGERIVDISEAGGYLHVRDGLLEVKQNGSAMATLPLGEVAAVVLSHEQVTVTRGALSGVCEAGGVVVTCDDRHLPIGMMLPLGQYHAPARRFAAQAAASAPTKKRLWQQLVVAKVRAQARLLKTARGNDYGLNELAREVRSGDSTNVEGQAARIYWPALFNDLEFLRERAAPDQNRYLNYGYAILRAVVARAICASGLHPCLGLHHHHRNNLFCLADDLMEPLRPRADAVVLEVIETHGVDERLKPEVKQMLLQGVAGEAVLIDREQRTPFDAAARMAASLSAAFESGITRLVLPEV
ncbi:MAG: type II CRISPR-associated endonuclease Cas1 [Phycisphaeraceae bacterium]|nr:type II CRISPR-associated endonuclease Cas1 [Phycisphaeraceae bacterium]